MQEAQGVAPWACQKLTKAYRRAYLWYGFSFGTILPLARLCQSMARKGMAQQED